MPQMGVSVAEGTIVEWRVEPGEQVGADQTICEVSTDKIDVEIPAPTAGVVSRLVAEIGETIAVGETIAEIDTGGGGDGGDGPGAPEQAPAAAEDRGDAVANGNGTADRSGIYSPVVQRMAEEHGIDLAEVSGSGVGGRIRKKDLLAHIASSGAETSERQSPSRPLHTESPYRPEPAPEPAPAATPEDATRPAAVEEGADPLLGPVRREPMSPIRQQTARHMLASRQTAAHATTITEVDFARVEARRAELAPQMAERDVKLTALAFVAQATVSALAERPLLNASIDGNEIVFHADVNLGIAVATDEGLIVPVIRKAQRLSLEGMAAAIADFAGRARSGGLEPDDVHGGTFTITNPGQFGSVLATPIINQPQVAILDLEAIVRRPVVIEAEPLPESATRKRRNHSDEAIAVRPIANLCLSWDHRALDGVETARFLAAIRRRLESGEVPG